MSQPFYNYEKPQFSLQPSFYFSSGSWGESRSRTPIGVFQELAPESFLLAQNYSGYALSGEIYNGGTFINSGLYLRPFQKKNGDPGQVRLRLGFIYFTSTPLSNGYFKSTIAPYDTLVSSTTGQQFFIDSVGTNNLSMEMRSRHVYVDAAITVSTKWKGRWSGYTGLGVAAGLSLQQQMKVVYSETSNLTGAMSGYTASFPTGSNQTSEYYEISGGWGFMVNTFFGIDWRLANHHDFWSQVSLYFELRPAIHAQWIAGLETRVMPGLAAQWGMQIRL